MSEGGQGGGGVVTGAGGATGTGAGGAAGAAAGSRSVRSAWATGTPRRSDYGDVVSELNTLKLVGEGSVFERGPHVPVTHLGYFKPPTDAFLSDLKAKDRRSAKEWEYINSAGVWTELGLAALEVAKDQEGSIEDLGRRLSLAQQSFKAALEVLSMRAQYFRDVTDQGVEIARQMSFLVEQGHDPVFSESYRTAREALSSKLEIEAAKQLAKARLERAGSRAQSGGGRGPSGGASGAADDE